MRRLLLATALVGHRSRGWPGHRLERVPSCSKARGSSRTASALIEDSAFVVDGDRITAVGARGTVKAPAGATVVDLRGKTVIPALVDAHSHLGYTDVRTGITSAASYTRDNLLDHLRRYAYYGIAATRVLASIAASCPTSCAPRPHPVRRYFSPPVAASRCRTPGRTRRTGGTRPTG